MTGKVYREAIEIPPAVRRLYPFSSHWLEMEGCRMHYLDEGSAEEGKPTVVLLHGNPTWSFLYREVIPRITPFCRAVAPDYLGMGLSDKPADEAFYTLENHTRMITRFIEQLGLKDVILVVQDWGGPIGLGYALAHADNVAGMLIMNTWAWPEPSAFHDAVVPWRMLHAPFAGAHFLLRRNVLIERGLYLSTVRNRHRLRQGPVLDGYRLPYRDAGSRIAILAFPRDIPRREGDANWQRMRELERGLGGIRFPCRLLWGEQDIVFPPANAHRFRELIPDCAAPRMIPDGAHFIQEDAPEEIAAEIIRLLQGGRRH